MLERAIKFVIPNLKTDTTLQSHCCDQNEKYIIKYNITRSGSEIISESPGVTPAPRPEPTPAPRMGRVQEYQCG